MSNNNKTNGSKPFLALHQERLLTSLQLIIGVIEKRQIQPILGNVLFKIDDEKLQLVATDFDIELVSTIPLTEITIEPNITNFTLSGKKLFDICRSLPANNLVEFYQHDNGQIELKSGRSKFTLATLPADEFPLFGEQSDVVEVNVKQNILRSLAYKTFFTIPTQNVRAYLNGMLLEIKDGFVNAVASDGIRLAFNAIFSNEISDIETQVIIPRKAVTEMMRFLHDKEDLVKLCFNDNCIKIIGEDFTFMSKLVAGKFPNYYNHIPRNLANKFTINRLEFKSALSRIGILSNELSRSFCLSLQKNLLTLRANNPEHEEAFEELNVIYDGEDMEILFNINYFLEILNGIESEEVTVSLKDQNSAGVIESVQKEQKEQKENHNANSSDSDNDSNRDNLSENDNKNNNENNNCSLYVLMPIYR